MDSTSALDSTSLPPDVTEPLKQSNAGLIAGAAVVGAIFLLVAAVVIYMCCCRCKQPDHPRKNSTYQMYSEVDASQMAVPGHLRTINSPIYGKEEFKTINEMKRNTQIEPTTNTQNDDCSEEVNNKSEETDPPYPNTI